MVVTTVVRLRERTLRVRGAAEFAAPDDQRVVEQAALLEVGEQTGRGLVGIIALTLDGLREAAVVIPAHVEELDEADVAFAEATGQEAVRGVGARALHVGTVEIEHMLGFLRQIEQLGHAGLHAEGHLVLGDSGLDLRVAEDTVALVVKGGELVELFAADFTRDTFGILEVEDAFAFIAELYPLEFGGQEARTPESVVERLVVRTTASKGSHHHVGGKVGIFAAETVGRPGADARATG